MVAVVLVFAAALWGALRQPAHTDPLQPPNLLAALLYPMQQNAFVEPVIRADLTTVFPMPDGCTVWAGGTGGLLIVSRDGGVSWDTAAVYGPANWDSIVEARRLAAVERLGDTAAATTTVTSDTTQGQASFPTDSAADPYPQFGIEPDTPATTTTTPLAVRSGNPRPGIERSAGHVRMLSRLLGTLAAPAPLHAQIRGGPPENSTVRLTEEVNDIFFLDARLGWAITIAGDVLATRDGGARWELYPSVTFGISGIGTLGFTDSLRGMTTTGSGVARTTDGGRTWTTVLYDSTDGQLTGRLVEGAVGYAVDEFDGNLMRTDDAGATWRSVPTPRTGSGFRGAYFRDARTGWTAYAEGARTLVYRTEDGARSWRRVATLPAVRIGMLRPGGMLLVAGQGLVMASLRGEDWDTVRIPVPDASLRFVVASTNGTGWAAGREGMLFVTRDTASTWQAQAGGRALLATAFTSRRRGWAAGRRGMLLRTDNGGGDWDPEASGSSADLHSIAFRTPRDGWAVGDGGTAVRRTIGTFGPRPWTPQQIGTSATEALRKVQFADTLTGWISGDSTLLRTVDGGRTWQRLPRPDGMREVQFTSARNGWAVRGYEVLRTDDGGGTWRAVSSVYAEAEIERLWFASDSVGWKLHRGALQATRDSGRTWTPRPLPGGRYIRQMRFLDERTGFAVGVGGVVYRTADGGVSWQRESMPTRRDLFDVAIAGERAWAVGAGNAIFRRDESGEWRGLRTTTTPAGWLYLLLGMLTVGAGFAVRRASHEERREAERDAETVEALLISDRPLQPGDPDPFDLNGLALGVSKFLRNPRTRPPLTIAVTGRWGTGKSSLMNLVRRDLEANRFRPVWFNAWHHQKEEHLLAALLESIRAQAVPRWLSFSGLLFRARLFWIRIKRHRPSALLVGLAAVLFLGYLAGDADRAGQLWSGLGRTALDPLGAGRRWVDGLAEDFGGGGSGSVVAYLTLATAGLGAAAWRAFRAFGVKPATLMATLAGRARLRDLQQQTGFRHQFAQEFSEVTRALHPMDMVLFVDDLDRCRPEQVLEVLESINFLVSSGDCVVVMGMDRDWVISCVGLAFDQIAQESINLAHPGDAGVEPGLQARDRRSEFARHYLEKLVNIEIPVPAPTAAQLAGLVRASAPGRRKEQAAALLPTTGPRILRDPRTAAYLALGVAVFIASLLAFRPRGVTEQEILAMESVSSATAAPRATPRDTAPLLEDTGAAALAFTPVSAQERYALGEVVGAPPVERAWAGLAAAAVVLALVMLVALLQRRDALVRDSRSFTTALGAWSGVIASRGFTPRITKKFLNRLRYYAMRQRALEPAQSPAGRLSQALRRFWSALWTTPSAPAAEEPESTPVIVLEERRAAAQGAIPEPVLVALACLHECHPTGIPQAAYNDFHGFVRTSPLTAAFSAEILSPELEYPPSLSGYRQRFEEISAGVRIH